MILRNGSLRGFLVLSALAASLLSSSCRSRGVDVDEVLASGLAESEGVDLSWHQGPPVALDASGPARFVSSLMQAFDADRAMQTVAFTDQFYRAPANDGYLAVLDHVRARLEAAGFGGEDERFELREIVTEMKGPSWTPRSGSMALHHLGSDPEVLYAFSDGTEPDRTILPLGAPSCDVVGRVCLSLDEIQEGDVFVTSARLGQVYSRAMSRGAAAVISAYLPEYNVDPSGADRHLDAVRYLRLPEPSELPVAQISANAYARISAAVLADPQVVLEFQADVVFEQRPMRTLVAAIRGGERPDECVVSAAHIQEPGAGDNASGVGGQVEGAIATAKLLRSELIDWPDRTLVFIWGDEFEQTRVWIEDTERTPVAGVSSDMVGNSPSETGARALLERMPDPGALYPIFPDEHTPWGAGQVDRSMVNPSGLAVIARCAMIDVGLHAGGWESADHPWEGGSDHDVFIKRGIPAVLIWHFTDFSYHTSLDRMDMVDGMELERTQVAILATMLAVADPQPQDLDRYVRSAELERALRVAHAEAEGDREHVVAAWESWTRGAVGWLRSECLRIPMDEATPRRRPKPKASEAPEEPVAD
ncbi:MAG: hypothetical protein P1V81_02135 [Planctomycetota bacterium]|nr:hypothetical protein [Planctomycetota bacterium]